MRLIVTESNKRPILSIPRNRHLKDVTETIIDSDQADEVFVGEEKPPRVQPRIKAAPKIRQMYICDFPADAHLPELWKRRPVIVLSYKNTLYGAVTVIPTTSEDSLGDPWLHKISKSIDHRDSYAICDKPTTVAVSRLTPADEKILRLDEDEFNLVLAKVLNWLPKIS